MRRRSQRRDAEHACAILVCLGAVACGPSARVLDHPLSPGDAVIVILDARRDADLRTELAFADAQGRVRFASETDEPLAFAVVRGEDVVDADGGAQPLSDLTADLGGDLAPTCGCSAPALDLPQRIASGDRCPLPGALPLTPAAAALEPAREAALRARLRLTWPGACPPAPQPLVTTADLAVCPLGTQARRIRPLRVAADVDGTVVGVARGLLVEVEPSGAVHETPIVPAVRRLEGVVRLPGRGTLVVADALGVLLAEARADLVWVPARGVGPAVRVRGVPSELRVYGALSPPRDPGVWLYGSLMESFATRGAVLRCTLDRDTMSCAGGVVSTEPACPSFGRDAVSAMTYLDDGTPTGVTNDGQLFVVREGTPRCLPETDVLPFRARDGSPIVIDNVDRLVAVGRRVVACLTGNTSDGHLALVVTATVGPWAGGPPRVRWETVAEGRGGEGVCSAVAYLDPREPDRVHMTLGNDRQVTITRSSTAPTVTEVDRATLFANPEDRFDQVATTSQTLSFVTARGELWGTMPGGRMARPRLALDPRGPVRAGGVLASADGFRVAGGSARTVSVRVPHGDDCEGISVEATPAAYVEGDARDDVLLALGDRVLAFGTDGDGPRMRVEGPTPALVALDGGAGVRAAAEIVPGKWGAFVRDDGSLWVTDGRAVERLDDGDVADWFAVDGANGVGWVASATELARLLPRAGGGLRLERDVLARVERSAFDALPRNAPAQLTAVRALRSGGAMLAFREALDGVVQGGIDDTTIWWLRSEPSSLTMVRYTGLGDRDSRPVYPQPTLAIAGDEHAPVLVFAGTEQSIGVHAPGARVTALPFNDARAVAWRGSDVLVIGDELRMAIVRVR